MRYHFLALLAGSLAIAQSTTETYITDVNGHRVKALSITSNSGRTERTQSINGREVPLEQTEERVVREDANGKITEKIVRKFDQTGRLASTDRVVTEEQTHPGGSSTMRATTFRSDLNGQMAQVERKIVESRTRGATTQADIVVERPTLNGSFEAVEKRSVTAEVTDAAKHETETVYRRAPGGEFREMLRQVSEVKKAGDQIIENTAYFEPGVTGKLQLARQSTSTTTKRPDGSEIAEINLYARAADGRVQDNEAPQQVKEQQIIERQKGPGGAVIETVSVRRPSISDPNRLGDLKKISETVCKGKCTP